MSKSNVAVTGCEGVGVGVWTGVFVGNGVELPIGLAVEIGELVIEGVDVGKLVAAGD